MGLDEVLEIVVPVGIFITILIFIYIKAQEPLDKLFAKVSAWIRGDDREPKYYSSEDYVLGYGRSDY